MPRPLRAVVPGQPLHLVQRGNNRSACFVGDDDRERYLRTLLAASRSSGCAVHAYVLMTNHVHLLVTAAETRSPARMMQAIGRSYVRGFNDRYGRTGGLWDGRFRSTLIESERYLLACMRYIESNPVRAGMVERPQRYQWSSFRCNALGERNALVTPHPTFLALGAPASSRRANYAALFSSPLEVGMVDAIRRATSAQTFLGSPERCAAFEATLRRPLGRETHGGSRRRAIAPK